MNQIILDIQICNVRGVALPGAGGLSSTAPEVLTRHYQAHHLKTFHCDRPKHKGPIDKDNEFKVLLLSSDILIIMTVFCVNFSNFYRVYG